MGEDPQSRLSQKFPDLNTRHIHAYHIVQIGAYLLGEDSWTSCGLSCSVRYAKPKKPSSQCITEIYPKIFSSTVPSTLFRSHGSCKKPGDSSTSWQPRGISVVWAQRSRTFSTVHWQSLHVKTSNSFEAIVAPRDFPSRSQGYIAHLDFCLGRLYR